MWITGDVELPGELLDSYERGEVVFFVGAGASIDAPSNLPLFGSLAEQLATMAASPFDDKMSLDYFIGRLESLPQGFDAHRHAQEIISNPESKFNAIHESIIDLAYRSGNLRIVTTNYDNHLYTVATEKSVEISNLWYGPALPLGDEFEGIVHLHGSINRPSKEMILTDRDFGRAYLTDAWATRFLLPMFKQFTVVFIGYSHDDIIMKYLASGLPSDGQSRYAFTHEPDDYKWKHLGITPISYPVHGKSHQALSEALKSWSERVKMGTTEHRSRLCEIIRGGTIVSIQDRDYLWERIKSEDGAFDFVSMVSLCSEDEKIEWLEWVQNHEIFKGIFNINETSEATAILANWFANEFIASVSLNGVALQKVQQAGQGMSDTLFRISVDAVKCLYQKNKEAGIRWQTLLATSISKKYIENQKYLISANELETVEIGYPLLSAMLRPSLKLKRKYFIGDDKNRTHYPDFDLFWEVDKYQLTQYVKTAVENSAPGDYKLGFLLENSIFEVYSLIESYDSQKTGSLSLMRSAIETHEQDFYREPIDALIDGLRDYGIKAISVHPDLPNRWWDFGYELMQRLALYLVANDDRRSPDQKLHWLLSRTGLYEPALKHETYQLLAQSLSSSSKKMKGQILVKSEATPEFPDDIPNKDRHIAYAKFNLLAWLTQSDPSWREAKAEFENIQRSNPSFVVRDHPDFDYWVNDATWGGVSAMEVDEFLRKAEENSEDALRALVAQDYSAAAFDTLYQENSLEIIKKSSCERPNLGVDFWKTISKLEIIDEKRISLRKAIILGWANADISEIDENVINLIAGFIYNENSAGSVAEFLFSQGMQLNESVDPKIIIAMRNVAKKLWELQKMKFSYPEKFDPLSSFPLYLNSWPGKLATYWSCEIDRRWRQSRENWEGLDSEESNALLSLLRDNTHAIDATQPSLASELYFYFAADEEFATEHLLPLFDDDVRHMYVWFPYLHRPRYNDRLLEAGLLESMQNEFCRIYQLTDAKLRSNFFELIISVLTYAGISDSARLNLLNQSVIASQGAYATEFADAVLSFIQGSDTDVSIIWDRWLRGHLLNRVKGIPGRLRDRESVAWANLVPYLGSKIPEASAMLLSERIGFTEAYLFSEIAPDDALKEHGNELVEFLSKRIRDTSVSTLGIDHKVQRLVEQVQNAVTEPLSCRLREAAIEKGFIIHG